MNFEAIRNDFPIFNHKIQLSSCSQSAMHIHVKESMERYVQSWEEGGMDWNAWMIASESAREKFAKLIGADKEEISIVSSVSHAVSSIANSLMPEGARNEVIITSFDFPTVGHVWLSNSDRFDIQFLDADEHGFISEEAYESVVTNKTLLVNTSHVSYYNGFKQNLKEVSKRIHDKGALLFVDAYQSAGQTPINVKEMGVDILAAGMQKYLLGVPGIAFLYIRKELAEQLTPRITGWFGQDNPFSFDIKNVNYARGAVRFDSGTFPMINGFAAESALDIFSQLEMSEIEAHLTHLSKVAINAADSCSLTIKGPTDPARKGSNTAFYVPNATFVEQKMKEKGFIVSARNDVIRIAPHFYNTEKDVIDAIYTLAEMMTIKTASN